uniref:F-box associated beta-propeller type 3 domain-containing protein n=1 Tax=Oryza glumipatula TaxID=40148 RepID=A0A0D9Z7D0_9ORYZ
MEPPPPCERPPVSLSDDMVAEILLLVHADSVGRLAAVSKQWRRVSADPTFLTARERRAPPLQLLRVSRRPSDSNGRQYDDAELSVVVPAPLISGGAEEEEARRPLARYVASFPGGYPHCTLLASCDGLLLFADHRRRLRVICNPTTRRWSSLPPHPSAAALGFYRHRPSGEYRVLSKASDPSRKHSSSYFVVSAGGGGGETRRLGGATADQLVERHPCSHLGHVAAGGKLYWIGDLVEAGRSPYLNPYAPTKLVAFDTVSEAFRLVAPPPETAANNSDDDVLMFELDGALAVLKLVEGGPMTLKLWVLDDDVGGGGEQWACRHKVQLGLALLLELKYSCMLRTSAPASVAVWDDGGGRGGGGVATFTRRRVTLYGVDETAARGRGRGRALHVFACGARNGGLQVAFKENTVAHAFFKTHPSPPVRTFGFL